MTREKEILLRCAPALRWLEDNPMSTPRAAARKFDCPVEMLDEWIRKHGTPEPGSVDQAKGITLTVTRVPRGERPAAAETEQNRDSAEIPEQKRPEIKPQRIQSRAAGELLEQDGRPNEERKKRPVSTFAQKKSRPPNQEPTMQKPPYLEFKKKPFPKTIDPWRMELQRMAAGAVRRETNPTFISIIARVFGTRNPSADDVKEFLAWFYGPEAGAGVADKVESGIAALSERRERAPDPMLAPYPPLKPQEIPAVVKLVIEIDVRLKCSTVS
jgi:hypothetical protein